MNEIKNLLPALIFSLLLHLLIRDIFSFAKIKTPPRRDDAFSRAIEVTPIDLNDLKERMRTVGVKDGKKDTYSELVPMASAEKKGDRIPDKEKNSKAPSKEIQKKSGDLIVFSPAEVRELNPNLLKDLEVGSANPSNIKGANFNIHFEPPEGVSEDELNTSEKIFYSFQRRTFKSYISSFISAYNDASTVRPRLTKIAPGRQTLTGKVTYDKEGNIVAIKIIRWSDDDDIQYLFEKTLENIHSLPNPPKALVEKSGEFTIYYQLNFSG